MSHYAVAKPLTQSLSESIQEAVTISKYKDFDEFKAGHTQGFYGHNKNPHLVGTLGHEVHQAGITKGNKDFKKETNKIAKLTDENWHGKAIEHGAKILNRPDLEDAAKQVNKEHMKAGHISGELYKRRNDIGDELHDHATKSLSPPHLKMFHAAF